MLETDSIALTRQYPKPSHIIIHASDTQLLGDRGSWNGYPLDADQKLEELAEAVESTKIEADAIIFTGDLADKGEVAAYRKLRSVFEPIADRIGAQLIWVMGNHDSREPFRAELLYEEPNLAPIDKVYDLNGLRIISLDSTVPGHHYGLISDPQLEWLQNELSKPAEHGTILALHHPPLPAALPIAQIVELQDQSTLADVVRNSDIRSIIAGHLHYSSFGTIAGIPVSVASSSCYTQDLAIEQGMTSPRNGAQGFNLVHVYEETVLHSIVPIGESIPVGITLTPEEVRMVLLEAGISN